MEHEQIVNGLLGSMGVSVFTGCCGCIGLIFFAICMWKIFEKCGIEGWKAFIPIYNAYCWAEAIFGNGILFLVSFVAVIPVIGWVAAFIWLLIGNIRTAKCFNHGVGFGVLLTLIPPVGLIWLALGSDGYSPLEPFSFSHPFDFD